MQNKQHDIPGLFKQWFGEKPLPVLMYNTACHLSGVDGAMQLTLKRELVAG